MKKDTTRKTCLKCGHEFTYRERLQSSYRLLWRMNCIKCGTRYSMQVGYRLALAVLMALPVAFGPSLYEYMGWDVWNVLAFIVFYAVVLLLLILVVVPVLPIKWDPVEEKDTSVDGKVEE